MIWSDHPNAIHIDRILHSVEHNVNIWDMARRKHLNDKLFSVWHPIWNSVNSDKWSRARADLWYFMFNLQIPHKESSYHFGLLKDSAMDAAQNALLCLLHFDDCGYMLDSDPDELHLLAKMGDGKAMLLLPACIALAESK